MKRKNFLVEMLKFLWSKKAYWIVPVILFLILLICLIAGWCVPYFWKKVFGEGFLGGVFNILLKFIVPIILICVLVTGI